LQQSQPSRSTSRDFVPLRLQYVAFKRDLNAVQPLDGIGNRDSLRFLLKRIRSVKAIRGVFEMPLFRSCGFDCDFEISLAIPCN
jgi:hypothetical protein